MKRFRNILLVAGLGDGPVPAHLFERALTLARRNGAKLALMDVVPKLELVPEVLPQEMFELTLRDRCESLLRLGDKAREHGLEVETALAAGTPFLEITRRVQQFRHDLVITDGGRGEAAGRVVDSTTMHLMRKCPCPIWVVRPHTPYRYTRVLAAIDPDTASRGKDSLNRKIIELAIAMARLESSELHVVQVLELHGLPAESSAEVWRSWEATARGEIKRRLDEFLAGYDLGVDARVHSLVGRPAAAIAELAGDEEVDLLVMGTVCRTGVRGFFIGNTAEEVLARVDCSLLTVKPDGFVSPV